MLGTQLTRGSRPLSRNRLGFVTSAFRAVNDYKSSFDYFALLTSEVVLRLQDYYDVVVRIPPPLHSGDTVGRPQAQLLKGLFEHVDYFDGYIVAPFNVSTIAARVVEFLSQEKDTPVVTIDQALGAAEEFSTARLPVPPAVIPNNEHGGSLAAEAIAKYYLSIPKAHLPAGMARVICIEGTGSSPIRYESFSKELKRRLNGHVVVDTNKDKLDFTRDDARTWVLQQLGRGVDVWGDVVGIFACNDELALGVSDALDQHLEREAAQEHLITAAVVGFDGIREVADRVGRPNERWLLNTVLVPIPRMAEKLAEIVKHVVRKGGSVRDINQVETIDCNLIALPDKQTQFEAFYDRRKRRAEDNARRQRR